MPHHLLDVVAPDEEYNVSRFLQDVTRLERDCSLRDVLPIFVGGTTMYVKSLLDGLADLPPGDARVRKELERMSSEELHAKLEEVDPASADRLHPHDRLRVIRCLETFRVTGESVTTHHDRQSRLPCRCPLVVVLCWPRDALYERINRRSALMVEDGILEEVGGLLERYERDETKALNAVGYREVCDWLQRDSSGSEGVQGLVEAIAQATRRYAKRQMTFWRNEPFKSGWHEEPEHGEGSYLGAERSFVVGNGKPKGVWVHRWTPDQLVSRVRSYLKSEIPKAPIVLRVDASFLRKRLNPPTPLP